MTFLSSKTTDFFIKKVTSLKYRFINVTLTSQQKQQVQTEYSIFSTKRNTQNSAHPPCCLTFFVRQLIIKSEAIKDIPVSVVAFLKQSKLLQRATRDIGYPLFAVGNSFLSTCGGSLCKITPQKQQVKASTLPLYSLALPPFCFQKGQPSDYPYHVLI